MQGFLANVIVVLLFVDIQPLTGQRIQISQADLQNLVDKFWDLDGNRAREGQIVTDFQARTGLFEQQDKAAKKFFAKVDPKLLEKPTYRKLLELYKFYSPEKGKAESPTRLKIAAIDSFLDAVTQTEIFKELQKFLKSKGLREANSKESLKSELRDIWFDDYSRAGGVRDSSGFEHVFLGENGKLPTKLDGLHNWVRFYWLEKQGKLDYTGYVKHHNEFVSLQVRMGDRWKPGASFFLGTSPEYDLAIYSLCYFTKRGKDMCQFNLYDCTGISVSTYDLKRGKETFVGSAFPSAKKASKCNPRQPSQPDSASYLTFSVSVFLAVFIYFVLMK